ncbi:MAG: tail fiber protein [Polyangiaceae bacterium]
MSEAFIGEIRATAFAIAPRGWALCNGQMLSIAQNQALFSILGTTYGGNGVTTFGLPDLRRRTPVGAGNNPAVGSIALGEAAGSPSVTLVPTQMPSHDHTLNASTAAGAGDPENRGPAAAKAYGPSGHVALMAAAAVAPAGGSQPHENMQPYLTINYIIALQGIYPSHS